MRGRNMARTSAGLLSLILFAVLANSALAADASKGERMAKRWCVACHVVAPDQARGNTQAPPFSEIAKTAGFTEQKLAFFLLAPHPQMPDMNLSRAEAADLAAYIARQGK
jgi:mono/diheme cytochrome c family protein